ncbi:MAG: M56 family metallopeptidase [Pyrinomonadaceae bacterium]
MRIISQLLFNILFNACWQIALITLMAMLCARLLRNTVARYQHLIWVFALAISFCLPVLTSFDLSRSVGSSARPLTETTIMRPISLGDVTRTDASLLPDDTNTSVQISRGLVIGLLALYLSFLLYRGIKLFRAWRRTRVITRSVHPIELVKPVQTIVKECQRAIGVTHARIVSSNGVAAPVTVGILKPLVILPEELLREADTALLTSAIGHELAHVARRDYFLNLLYELIFLPVSFHPAAAFVRRRINQTRELTCDEMVADRLLNPEVYARSLVQLAGSAILVSRRAETITVGINDADILEVRIMSLLRRTTSKVRKNRLLLIAAAALLLVPCVVAGSLAVRFTTDAPDSSMSFQGASQQDQEKKEKAESESSRRAEREMKEREMKERAERDPQFKAELEARARRGQEEMQMKAQWQAELARMAKISMEQAIQIATSQQPGKVFECSLVGKRSESSEKSAKIPQVFYHVVILSGDESTPTLVHVLINATDGSVFKTEREEPTKERKKEQP